ncbi:hypothetical protein KR018_009178 [Drosophila ironensis]|nr:hypothetical protein KR018_009178 [Drosophila ironensis]
MAATAGDINSPHALQSPHLSTTRVIQLELSDEERSREISANKYGGLWVHVAVAGLLLMMLVVLFCTVPFTGDDLANRSPREQFEQRRREFVRKEQRMQLGSQLEMSPLEQIANNLLLAAKQADKKINHIRMNYQFRPPSFLGHRDINKTNLYGLMRRMPKGGLLHIHDSGMMKLDVIINLANRENLWVCESSEGNYENFRFSKDLPNIKPAEDDNYECSWILAAKYLNINEHTIFRRKLTEVLTIRQSGYEDSEELARQLRRAQRLVHGLVTYKPLWNEFLFNMLSEFYNDGVMYVELRSSLPIMYDLEGTEYTILDSVGILVMILRMFQSTHTDFIGLKLIYAPSRDFNDSRLDAYLENARLIKSRFPGIFAGFDLNPFGDECNLPVLGEATQLLNVGKDLDFYFHAGESRCPDNNQANTNLIDALLLGSRRLGNSVNIPQHPQVLQALKTLSVAIEVCPLSNHYLQYFDDFRQHPVAYLIAAGYPVVIGSDYPYLWNSTPLTDDFYVAFVGVVSELQVLKQLALNSFLYSSLSMREQQMALRKWSCRWDRWIRSFVNDTKLNSDMSP